MGLLDRNPSAMPLLHGDVRSIISYVIWEPVCFRLEHTYNSGLWNLKKQIVRSPEIFTEGRGAPCPSPGPFEFAEQLTQKGGPCYGMAYTGGADWGCGHCGRCCSKRDNRGRRNVSSPCRERNHWVRVGSRVSCPRTSLGKQVPWYQNSRRVACNDVLLDTFIGSTAHSNSAGIQICPWLASTGGLC